MQAVSTFLWDTFFFFLDSGLTLTPGTKGYLLPSQDVAAEFFLDYSLIPAVVPFIFLACESPWRLPVHTLVRHPMSAGQPFRR